MKGMRYFSVAAFAIAIATPSVGQVTYDVKTINFDLWCQEQANLPPDRCDKRLPQDEERYEAFRDKIEKFEISHLQDKNREVQFNDKVMHADPVDNPPETHSPPPTPTSEGSPR